MQALKAIGLVDGVPGPKGGYNPTAIAYKELNLTNIGEEVSVPISRNGEPVNGVRVSEIDFTTLCHPDLCHADVKLIGSVKMLEIGDHIVIGPTPVNKLILGGEIIGKDEVKQVLQFFAGLDLVFDGFERLSDVEVGTIEELVGLTNV